MNRSMKYQISYYRLKDSERITRQDWTPEIDFTIAEDDAMQYIGELLGRGVTNIGLTVLDDNGSAIDAVDWVSQLEPTDFILSGNEIDING